MKFNIKRNSKRKRWMMDCRVNGRRIIRYFKSKELAESERDRVRQEIFDSGAAWVGLSASERSDLMAVAREIKSAGLTIMAVWEKYQRGGNNLALPSKNLRDAVAECIASKKISNRRKRYTDNLKWLLLKFISGKEMRQAASITTAEVESWLAGKSLITRKTYLSQLSALFSFCKKRGYIDASPIDRIDRVTIEHQPPVILTTEQCATVLAWAKNSEPDFLAWLCLTLLCGLRPEEADKTPASAVDMASGFVTVDAAASKVRSRRLVPILPMAARWFALAKDSRWQMPHATRRRMQRKMRTKLGFEKWPQDLLRHTFASYAMAHEQDAGRVASWLGNSAPILFKHYRELVTPDDAKRFWEL